MNLVAPLWPHQGRVHDVYGPQAIPQGIPQGKPGRCARCARCDAGGGIDLGNSALDFRGSLRIVRFFTIPPMAPRRDLEGNRRATGPPLDSTLIGCARAGPGSLPRGHHGRPEGTTGQSSRIGAAFGWGNGSFSRGPPRGHQTTLLRVHHGPTTGCQSGPNGANRDPSENPMPA